MKTFFFTLTAAGMLLMWPAVLFIWDRIEKRNSHPTVKCECGSASVRSMGKHGFKSGARCSIVENFNCRACSKIFKITTDVDPQTL